MKRVLVTGGRSNLGEAIRNKFGREGYEVWYTELRTLFLSSILWMYL